MADIRNFGFFFLSRRLNERSQKMFFNQFLHCVFNLNSCDSHPAYNKFLQTEQEKTIFSLKENKKARVEIYTFLLNQLSDQQKIQLTEKIVQEILGGVVDDTLKLDASTEPVLRDALEILSSSEIKLSQLKRKPGGVEEEEDEEGAAAANAAMEKAKTSVISQLFKKNTIENIIPVLVSLKHVLQNAKSSLVTSLMNYLRILVQDYKDEIDDIFASDPQTACEIRFDLRAFEQRQSAASVRRQSSSASAARPSRSIIQSSPVQIINKLKSPASCPKLSRSALKERQRAATTPTPQKGQTTPLAQTLFKTPHLPASKTRSVTANDSSDRCAVSRFEIDSILVNPQRGISTPTGGGGESSKMSFRISPITKNSTENVVYLESPFKAPSKSRVWTTKLPNEDK